MTKICEFCAKPLVRRDGERSDRFAIRRFCGYGCHNNHKRKVLEPRYCRYCEQLIRRGPKEKPYVYMKRMFCSVVCGGKATKGRAASPALLAALERGRNRVRQRTCKQSKKHLRPVKFRSVPRPTPVAISFESPEEWMRTHQVTKCPTRYAAPVYSQNLHGLSIRRDGRVR